MGGAIIIFFVFLFLGRREPKKFVNRCGIVPIFIYVLNRIQIKFRYKKYSEKVMNRFDNRCHMLTLDAC